MMYLFIGIIIVAVGAVVAWLLTRQPPDRARIRAPVSAPLFTPQQGGPYMQSVTSTWGYLAMNPKQRAEQRWWVKRWTLRNETPVMAFILTPANEAGMIFTPWPHINKENLKRACRCIEELVNDGIGVFPTLYVDDKPPWWYQIEAHVETWRRVHDVIGKHVNGYLLSIESNEQTRSVTQLQHCIHIMREAMPGVEYYGTHLQRNAKSKVSAYRWTSVQDSPANANVIFAEHSWHPMDGNNRTVTQVMTEARKMKAAVRQGQRLCFNEFNWHVNDEPESMYQRQRTALRGLGEWGAG